MRIRDKIKRPRRPVVAYEILPPREKDGTLNSYAETISSLLSQTHIDAINIPNGKNSCWEPNNSMGAFGQEIAGQGEESAPLMHQVPRQM